MEQPTLVFDFVVLLVAALVGGMVAHRLRQPVILGYLIVGAAIGPHSLGLMKDLSMVEASATIGVTLLMLTLGLEVSIVQMKDVGKVGLWGGIAQIWITAALGILAAGVLLKWPFPEAVLFGLVIALSSTAVCLKILMERGELDSMHGRIMIAILILQDISVILIMVILPLIGQNQSADGLPFMLFSTAWKTAIFIAIVIVSGIWILPFLMGRLAGVRSRELFLLIVLVMGLGAALGTQILGLSAVFGAFLIGLVLRQTRFAHQALAEVTPLRDIFAALFFVSLGMLLNPAFLLERWQLVAAAVGIIFLIKFFTVYGIVRSFGYGGNVALLTGAGLFQIGEFGFVLAQGSANAGVLSLETYSIIIGAAIITMLLTPLSMSVAPRLMYSRLFRRDDAVTHAQTETASVAPEVVVAGYGRIGKSIVEGLHGAGVRFSIIELDPEVVETHCSSEIACHYGDASNAHVLSHVNLGRAKVLVITFPDPLAVLNTAKEARKINPALKIVARVHRVREAEELRKLGVKELVSPEYEASLTFLRRVLHLTGWSKTDIERTLSRELKAGQVTEFSTDESI